MISLGFPALAWLSGAYVSELRARAARSRREQELETGRAVAEEQARVGRELHDVIAHTLSVIVIQAGAAEDVFDTSPQAARQALRLDRRRRAGRPWPSCAGCWRPSARSPARRRTGGRRRRGCPAWASCWTGSGPPA